MKKTLLMAAAALAAGVISSQAGVYSQNIVGYVNVPLKGGNAFNFITSPIGGTNAAEAAIPNIAAGDNVYVWTGTGYNILTYVSSNFDGAGDSYVDANSNPQPSPILNPGQLFIYQTPGLNYTNTFVGTVVLTNSIVLKGGNAFNYIASTPPVADTLDGTNIAIPFSAGDNVYLWTGSGYNILTYVGKNFDGIGDTWVDVNSNPQPSPTINVGQGFIYQTPGASYTWTQNLQVQ
jgi:hypothetical protein